MALLMIDGFDHYDDDQILDKWNTKSTATYPAQITTDGGRRGGGALFITHQACWVSLVVDARSEFIVGLAVKVTEAPTTYPTHLISFNYVGSAQVTLLLEEDLTLSVGRGGHAARLATSSVGLTLGVWHYVEFKAKIDNAAGSYTVRIDGNVVLTGSGADTQYSSTSNVATSISIGQYYAGYVEMYIDDLYICNTDAGVATFLGDCRVDTLYPTDTGTYSEFVASAGTNYECVDDTTPNDNTDYVSSSTLAAADSYEFGDISHTPAGIYGVQVSINATKDDAGDRFIGDLVDGVPGYNQPLASDYKYLRWVHETYSGSAWTKSDVNDAEFGVVVGV